MPVGAPYGLSVAANSGPNTTAGFATNISPGPANEAAETVIFDLSNDSNALFSVQPAIASNGALTFTPDSTWTGTIDNVSVKIITPSAATQIVRNSNGSAGLEFRAGGIGLFNTFVGVSAGQANTTGSNNTANGYQSFFSNITGLNNTANGYQSQSSSQ